MTQGNCGIVYCASDPLYDFCIGFQELYIKFNQIHTIKSLVLKCYSIYSLLKIKRVIVFFLLLKHVFEYQDKVRVSDLVLGFHSILLIVPMAKQSKTKQNKSTDVLSPNWRIYPYAIYAWHLAVGMKCFREILKVTIFPNAWTCNRIFAGESNIGWIKHSFFMTSIVCLFKVFTIYDENWWYKNMFRGTFWSSSSSSSSIIIITINIITIN